MWNLLHLDKSASHTNYPDFLTSKDRLRGILNEICDHHCFSIRNNKLLI